MFVKELKIFIILFVILALTMHFSAWLDHPLVHLEALPNSTFGLWHPIFLTLAVYLLIGVLRVFVHLFKKMMKKKI